MAHLVLFPILLLLMALGNTNAGITRQLEQMLPNNERITRSVHYPVEDDSKTLETMPVEETKQRLDRHVRSSNINDLATAENHVFRPLFRKKSSRRVLRSALEDLSPAENNVVFKPLFRRRPNKRLTRSVPDDMQTAENNIVFRPQFRRNPSRRVRSLGDDLEVAGSQYEAYYQHGEKKDDSVEHHNGSDNDSDDDVTDEAAEASGHVVRREVSQNGGELMDTAANTIVFRPLFRSNGRGFNRQRN